MRAVDVSSTGSIWTRAASLASGHVTRRRAAYCFGMML